MSGSVASDFAHDCEQIGCQPFSGPVTVGTIFHRSDIETGIWFVVGPKNTENKWPVVFRFAKHGTWQAIPQRLNLSPIEFMRVP